jgi:hypothetical protein
MLTLEGMAQRHLAVANAARATGLTPTAIAPAVAAATRRELETLIAIPVGLSASPAPGRSREDRS